MEEQFQRIEVLLGKDNMKKIHSKKVAIFGIGGVGSYVAESLIRAGITKFVIIDKDKIDITNINRQIHATHETVGNYKVEEMKKRMNAINPEAQIEIIREYVDETNIEQILSKDIDYIVDAIDTVKSKVAIIKLAKKLKIEIISSMGTGAKLDPTKLCVTDIYKTKNCPLAKVMRKELRKENIENLVVVYSEEESIKTEEKLGAHVIGSTPFVPATAGLIIGSQIVRHIVEGKWGNA